MRHRLTLAAALLLLPSCASLARQVPAYPGQGQTARQIQADTAECTTWAESATDDPGRQAVSGGATGAVILGGVGAAIGAAIYAILKLNPAEGAAVGATWGGIMGAAEGAGAAGESASQRRRGAYAVCMGSRGYTVAAY